MHGITPQCAQGFRYYACKKTKAVAKIINNAPKIIVTRTKNASNPLAFCLPNNCSAPPVNELAAFVLDGCIATTIINSTHNTNIIAKIVLYKDFPPYYLFLPTILP